MSDAFTDYGKYDIFISFFDGGEEALRSLTNIYICRVAKSQKGSSTRSSGLS